MCKTIKKIIMVCIFAFIFIAFDKKVFATSISFSNNNPKVGEAVRVTVTVPNVNTASVYANVTGPGINTQVKVVGADMSGGKQTYSNSVTVTPTAAGKITVSVTNNSSAVADGGYVNVGASAVANVTAPVAPSPSPSTNPGGNTGNNNQGGNTGNNNQSGNNQGGNTTTNTKNSNANLSKFGFNPSEYDTFKFNANTLQYRVDVPNELSSIIVYAEAAYGRAKVSGAGTRSLKEGSNRIDVTVTAEDGTTKKTYTLWVNRAIGGDGEVPPNVIDEPVEEQPEVIKGLASFEITGYELDKEFKTDLFEYNAKTEEKITKEWLEEVKKKLVYTATADGLTVEVMTDVLDNEKGTITIVVKEGETEVAKYVVTFEREKKEEKPVAALINSSNSGNGTGRFNLTYERRVYILLGIFGVTLATAIFFAVDSYWKTRRLEEYDDEQEFEEDSEFEKMNAFYTGYTDNNENTVTANATSAFENTENNNVDRLSSELDKEEMAEDTASEVTSSLRRLGGYRNMRSSGKTSGRHF